MKILVITSRLWLGGAEKHLVRLVSSDLVREHKILVVTFSRGGACEEELKNLNIDVQSLRKKSRWDLLLPSFRMFKLLRKFKPDLIYSVLPTVQIFSLVLGRLFSDASIVWGIRSSRLEYQSATLIPSAVAKVLKLLSPLADGVVFNSFRGRDEYHNTGFKMARPIVIPNGVDTAKFSFSKSSRNICRKKYKLTERDCIVGVVGRAEFNKGPDRVLKVMDLVLAKTSNIFFWIIGRDWDRWLAEAEPQLKRRLRKYVDLQRVVFHGECTDVHEWLSAFDIFLSLSRNEGMPNSLLEAMSCGSFCIATDVGDSRVIANDTGHTLDQHVSIEEIASVILRAVSFDKNTISINGMRARRRAVEQFSQEREVSRFLDYFEETIRER